MKRSSSFVVGKLLSRTQISLIGMSILLLTALGSVAVMAYVNINTSDAFQAGYVITDLAHLQREISRLRAETNRLLWNTSANYTTLERYRNTVDTHMELALTEAVNNPRVTTGLKNIQFLLEQYDYYLRRLRLNPTTLQYETAAYQLGEVLDLLDKQILSLYSSEETLFYKDISDALRLQRTIQAMTIGIGSLFLLVSVLLIRSISQTLKGEFKRTYHRLEMEVNERRHVEEELRRRNVYLAALHETSLALMKRMEPADLLEALTARAAQLLGTEHGYVYLVDQEHQELERKVGIGLFSQSIGFRLKAGTGLAGKVWQSGKVRVENNYAEWLGRVDTPGIVPSAAPRAVMGVPLTVAEQDIVGVIGVAYDLNSGRTFGNSEVEVLQGFARLASIALDNAQLFEQANQRMRQIEVLYRADEDLYRHLKIEQVLQSLVDVAVNILNVDKSVLFVLEEHTQHLKPRAARGFRETTLAQMDFPLHNTLIGQAVLTGKPVAIEDTHDHTDLNRAIIEAENIHACLHIPIVLEERVFGVFNVNYTVPHHFTNDDLRLFTALAQRTARAIKNAYLYEQAQQAATLEERQRLARELHDAVTQTLFSASIIADVLPRLWAINQEEGVRRLTELRELTRGAMAEMRTLLLELRPTALADTPLSDLLYQLSDAIRGRARLPVHITADEVCELPQDVKVAFYRIAQEALNNIAKHAAASYARIELHTNPHGTITLNIQDDGKGFNLNQNLPDHLGLYIMRERAESVGARLTIESQIGKGTGVYVVWRA
ncbi:MAG: GAF domain-containing sensor histidine kinase [Anaerolineae bacterium]|nr:GAF domain-containing sensor histidine kinase [Anaerolineae bacterium]